MASRQIATTSRKRKTTRHKGFKHNWKPDEATRATIAAAQAILRQYEAFLPLSIRQIYYRMVEAYGLDKTEKAYRRLANHLSMARRARLIPFEAIRDDGFIRREAKTWEGPRDYIDWTRAYANQWYRRDRLAGQAKRLVVWCEAGGMVPQLETVAAPYGVPVYSSGGFDSITAKYEVARLLADQGNVEVLHVGDHDPSGVHMYSALADDIIAFQQALGGKTRFTRLVITPEQVTQYGLPTRPPKKTDKRAFDGETVQAEALPPDVLNSIVEKAIASRLNPDCQLSVLNQEARERNALVSFFHDIAQTFTDEARG